MNDYFVKINNLGLKIREKLQAVRDGQAEIVPVQRITDFKDVVEYVYSIEMLEYLFNRAEDWFERGVIREYFREGERLIGYRKLRADRWCKSYVGRHLKLINNVIEWKIPDEGESNE